MDSIVLTAGLCIKNSERTVQVALDSLIRQNYPHRRLEIIVVDGQSTDKTLEVVRNILSKTDIRISVFSDGGKGLGEARQIVIDKALGRYIVFIGSDVVLPNDFLRKQLSSLEQNQRVGAAIPEFEYTKCEKNLMADVQNLLLSAPNSNVSNGTIFRKDALDEIDGFDKRIKGASEDRDVIFRLKAAGWNVVMNPAARFSQAREETSKEVYSRYFWYGYGDHFTFHKNESLLKTRQWLPPIYVTWGLKISFEAYKKYSTIRVFLIPFLCLFASVSWWLGFASAHSDGYGHSLTLS